MDLRKEANGEAGRNGIRGVAAVGEMEAEAEAVRRFFFPRELGEGKRMKRRRRGTEFFFLEALGGGIE